jgi:hypothetical protein
MATGRALVTAKRLADGRYECQNCLKRFTRSASKKSTIEPKFCGDPCRKEWHKTGALSLRKIKAFVTRCVREEYAAIKAEEARA